MWTEQQSDEMIKTAQRLIPGIKTYAIPHGLQVAKGPEGIIEHLKEQIPLLLG